MFARLRMAAATLAICLAGGRTTAAPVPAAPVVPAPTVTVQIRAAGQLLHDIRGIAKISSDAVAEMFETWLKNAFQEQGLTGLDMLRPAVGYAYVPANAADSWGVLVLPVTSEKEFLALLTRAGAEFEEKKDAKGLYELTQVGLGTPEGTLGDTTVLFRFHDRHVYVGIRAKPEQLATTALVPVGTLVDPAETAHVTIRLHVDRLDPAYKKRAAETMDEWAKQLDAAPAQMAWQKSLADAGLGGLQVLKRNVTAVLTSGDRVTVRLAVNPDARLGVYELAIRPAKGSAMAADIAGWKPAPHPFAGITPATAVGGSVIRVPLPTPELRDAAATLATAAFRAGDAEVGESFKPLLGELEKGVARTIKTGSVDFGTAVTGPDKGGLYTVVAALAYDDPTGLEKELRALVKGSPAARALVRLDAAKAGGFAVHTAAVGGLLPPEAQKLFGKDATVYLAFGPQAVYAAFGPNGPAELTRVVALKPAPAPLVLTQMNTKRVLGMFAAVDENAAKELARQLPSTDELVNAASLDVRGGDELVVHWESYLTLKNDAFR
ncbi:hypothetical protein [Fimbriiglobus ruber]|uniref:Uncharacterized protein n=1 Tax=Fimbriiglobus ruber TaxID=1908690 RepID=A0A225DPQ8_9BACT|nr:hypothetical protein [Fimbriiglobus ruber]OWK43420.1 hypothetical protein FRUB_03019 [Fimbriiglobus ruber]